MNQPVKQNKRLKRVNGDADCRTGATKRNSNLAAVKHVLKG